MTGEVQALRRWKRWCSWKIVKQLGPGLLDNGRAVSEKISGAQATKLSPETWCHIALSSNNTKLENQEKKSNFFTTNEFWWFCPKFEFDFCAKIQINLFQIFEISCLKCQATTKIFVFSAFHASFKIRKLWIFFPVYNRLQEQIEKIFVFVSSFCRLPSDFQILTCKLYNFTWIPYLLTLKNILKFS